MWLAVQPSELWRSFRHALTHGTSRKYDRVALVKLLPNNATEPPARGGSTPTPSSVAWPACRGSCWPRSGGKNKSSHHERTYHYHVTFMIAQTNCHRAAPGCRLSRASSTPLMASTSPSFLVMTNMPCASQAAFLGSACGMHEHDDETSVASAHHSPGVLRHGQCFRRLCGRGRLCPEGSQLKHTHTQDATNQLI